MRLFKAAWAVPVLAGLAIGGCSVQVDTSDSGDKLSPEETAKGAVSVLEQEIGRKPDNFTCPDGLEAKEGATTRCELTAGGTKYGTTVTFKGYGENQRVRLNVQVDKKPMS